MEARRADALPVRYAGLDDIVNRVPVSVVWEITLACDLACSLCGSRAGQRRRGELNTAEALDLVDQIAELGARDVGLIGGEAYLRKDWLEIVAAIRAAGMRCDLQTGGRNLSEERVARAAAAGLCGVGISLDGIGATHDKIRGVPGSYALALAALRRVRAYGLSAAVNSQINAYTLPQLRELMDVIIEAGATNWQLAITTAMGNAADHPDMLLQPWMLLDLLPRLDALKTRALRDGILLMPGNNLGYFGPEEFRLRSQQLAGSDHFRGCQAGRFVMGIESDGGIKGCPSLQSASYVVGRWGAEGDVDTLWNSESDALRFNEQSRKGELWGRCASCEFAKVCQAGCSFTAHAFFGRRGNNPYCHYRAIRLRREGLRERLVMKRRAPGLPFDHAQFGIVEEPFDAPVDDVPVDLIQLRRRR